MPTSQHQKLIETGHNYICTKSSLGFVRERYLIAKREWKCASCDYKISYREPYRRSEISDFGWLQTFHSCMKCAQRADYVSGIEDNDKEKWESNTYWETTFDPNYGKP